MFRPLRVLVALAAILLVSATAQAQIGPPGGTIYAHDVAYQTVATPRDLPPQGPFDKIYVLGNGLAAVAESAPGDQDYNGGRWEVHLVEFLTISPTQFTNAEDLLAAAGRSEVQIGGVARRFVCPLIPKKGMQ
jgi:hypothetical protein